MTQGAPYAPFMDPRTTHPPGLSPLGPEGWIVRDPDYAAQMAERDALTAEKPDLVLAALPEAAAPLAELRAALLAEVAGKGWTVGADRVTRPDGVVLPLDLPDPPFVARLVAEDMLLLAPGAEYRLIGGALCFPSRWLFSEKLGKPLTEIHEIVPGYATGLAARVNRVFAALAVGRPLVRVNWGAHATDALHQPHSRTWKLRPTPVTGRFWLRTERQTLLRLPQTGVVVFGIKLSVTPFEDLTPEQRMALRAGLAGFDAEEIAYRGGPEMHLAAIAALD